MVSLIFHLFSAALILLISSVAYQLSHNKKKVFTFPLTLLLWLIAVYFIGETDFYVNYDLPPRFVIFGIVPSFLLLAFLTLSKSSKKLLLKVPLHYPIYFQSFRIIVELLIFWTYINGIAPKAATFLGYNYEFYFGISAIIVGTLVLRKKITLPALKIWNILGLCMLAFIVGIFFTSVFAYDTFWGESSRTVADAMLKMPYISIAILYMPLAVWMHIFSLQQIKMKQKNE